MRTRVLGVTAAASASSLMEFTPHIRWVVQDVTGSLAQLGTEGGQRLQQAGKHLRWCGICGW